MTTKNDIREETVCGSASEILPVSEAKETENSGYRFVDVLYEDIHALAEALATCWEDGKKALFGGSFADLFQENEPLNASLCQNAKAEFEAFPADADWIFLDFLYRIDPDLKEFYFKGTAYTAFSTFGKDLLQALRRKDSTARDTLHGMLRRQILTKHMERLFGNSDRLEQAKVLEDVFSDENADERTLLLNDYAAAYLIADEISFETNGQILESIEQLTQYMKSLLDISYETFEDFCHTLIDYNDVLDPQLEAFLLALGKREALAVWRAACHR